MKCPKCGYNSFDHLDACKKCGHGLNEFKSKFGLRGFFSAGFKRPSSASESTVTQSAPDFASQEASSALEVADSVQKESSIDDLLEGQEEDSPFTEISTSEESPFSESSEQEPIAPEADDLFEFDESWAEESSLGPEEKVSGSGDVEEVVADDIFAEGPSSEEDAGGALEGESETPAEQEEEIGLPDDIFDAESLLGEESQATEQEAAFSGNEIDFESSEEADESLTEDVLAQDTAEEVDLAPVDELAEDEEPYLELASDSFLEEEAPVEDVFAEGVAEAAEPVSIEEEELEAEEPFESPPSEEELSSIFAEDVGESLEIEEEVDAVEDSAAFEEEPSLEATEESFAEEEAAVGDIFAEEDAEAEEPVAVEEELEAEEPFEPPVSEEELSSIFTEDVGESLNAEEDPLSLEAQEPLEYEEEGEDSIVVPEPPENIPLAVEEVAALPEDISDFGLEGDLLDEVEHEDISAFSEEPAAFDDEKPEEDPFSFDNQEPLEYNDFLSETEGDSSDRHEKVGKLTDEKKNEKFGAGEDLDASAPPGAEEPHKEKPDLNPPETVGKEEGEDAPDFFTEPGGDLSAHEEAEGELTGEEEVDECEEHFERSDEDAEEESFGLDAQEDSGESIAEVFLNSLDNVSSEVLPKSQEGFGLQQLEGEFASPEEISGRSDAQKEQFYAEPEQETEQLEAAPFEVSVEPAESYEEEPASSELLPEGDVLPIEVEEAVSVDAPFSGDADTVSQAPLSWRMGAFLVDMGMLGIIIVLFLVLGKMTLAPGTGGGLFPSFELLLDMAVPYFLVLFSVSFGYFTLFHFLSGQTLGEMLFRLRVEGADGQSLLFSQAFLRSVGGLLIFLSGGIGYLFTALDKDHCGWNDRLAGSRVVIIDGQEADEKNPEPEEET